MKLIGYWLVDLFDDEFIAPQEFATRIPDEVRERVAKYLDSGLLAAQYRGFSQCRYYCGLDHNGNCELSDGEWQWPSGLAHYVREHGVPLPQEFVEKACSGLPLPSEVPMYAPTSLEFWIHWCGEHRNRAFLEDLAQERRRAEERIAIETAALVDDLKATRGTRAESCAWSGCTEHSLSDIVFCALHSISSSEIEWIRINSARKRPLLEKWRDVVPRI
jgi:hypothetical protein